jgi:hypothetical protein
MNRSLRRRTRRAWSRPNPEARPGLPSCCVRQQFHARTLVYHLRFQVECVMGCFGVQDSGKYQKMPSSHSMSSQLKLQDCQRQRNKMPAQSRPGSFSSQACRWPVLSAKVQIPMKPPRGGSAGLHHSTHQPDAGADDCLTGDGGLAGIPTPRASSGNNFHPNRNSGTARRFHQFEIDDMHPKGTASCEFLPT